MNKKPKRSVKKTIVKKKPAKKMAPKKRCKPEHNYTPREVMKDLEGYLRVDDMDDLLEWDRIKYIRKDTLEYRKGGWIVNINKAKKYIVVEGFSRDWKTCRNFRFSINWDNVIIFVKDELLEEEIDDRDKRKSS